jgi:hypothetical protein
MRAPQATFIDGLLWYLETRNWSFGKIKTCPTGSHPRDIKMYHYLYFSNLLGAVDLVADYFTTTGEVPNFRSIVKKGFGATDNYKYVRELRNTIVHRGLDPAGAGHTGGKSILVLCPAQVWDRDGNNAYTCTFRYTAELAESCNRIVDIAIFEILDRHGFLNPGRIIVSREQTLHAIKCSTAMPDWAKSMAQNALGEMDFVKIATEIAESKINQLRSLLGRK